MTETVADEIEAVIAEARHRKIPSFEARTSNRVNRANLVNRTMSRVSRDAASGPSAPLEVIPGEVLEKYSNRPVRQRSRRDPRPSETSQMTSEAAQCRS